jgi:hypothetical protein
LVEAAEVEPIRANCEIYWENVIRRGSI